MKKLKKVLSLLLVGVIAVTSLVCGSVTAGAQANPDYWINGFYGFYEDYYTVFLDGITQEEMNTVASNMLQTNLSGVAHIQFKDHELLTILSKGDNNEILGNCAAFRDGNQTDFVGWDLFLTNEEGLTPISYIDDIPDNGTYCVCFYFDPKDSEQKKMIEELQKYDTADYAGFGLVTITEDTKRLVYIGTYGGTLNIDDFYAENVPAYMNDESDSSSKSVSSLTVSKISDKAYTGKALKPDVTIKDGDKTLTKDTDYTLSYKNNKNIGKATVTITGKGSYTGTKTVTFKIVPKKTTLTAKKSSGKYALSWKKVSGIDKYQIQYSTDGGKTYKKLANVSSGKTSYSKKLDTSKTYTFRIRSYKTVNGTNYYSSWSKAVTVK